MKKGNSVFGALCVWMLLLVGSIFSIGFLGVTATLASATAPKALKELAWIIPFAVFGNISMFETRTMLAAMEKMFFPKTFLLDLFFKVKNTFTTENVDIDIIKGKRRLAPFVSPMVQGKVIDRTGFVTRSIKPPYIKEKMPFSGADILKRQAGETIYQGNSDPATRAQQQLGKDLLELDGMITRREEWMAAKALFDGKVQCKGDGIDVQVDFLRDASLTITLGALFWGAADGVPITNLRTWKQLVGKLSGVVPDSLILAGDVVMPFLANAEVQKFMDKTKITLGQIDPKALPSGATYYGNVDGLDIYSYDEWYLDDAGVLQPMVPAKKILIGSTKARCECLYGAIQDLKATAAVARFPKSWEEEDPSVRWIMLQSAPIPATLDTDAFLTATVLQ
ncbi:MAG: major capsid protein E [Nitrospirae bacterium]|nr:MAG: major capsid protein E [Nitrospirota bacterium]